MRHLITGSLSSNDGSSITMTKLQLSCFNLNDANKRHHYIRHNSHSLEEHGTNIC